MFTLGKLQDMTVLRTIHYLILPQVGLLNQSRRLFRLSCVLLWDSWHGWLRLQWELRDQTADTVLVYMVNFISSFFGKNTFIGFHVMMLQMLSFVRPAKLWNHWNRLGLSPGECEIQSPGQERGRRYRCRYFIIGITSIKIRNSWQSKSRR